MLKMEGRLNMDRAGLSETQIPIYKTAWNHISEDCNLYVTTMRTSNHMLEMVLELHLHRITEKEGSTSPPCLVNHVG
jgi:hypothetical protein